MAKKKPSSSNPSSKKTTDKGSDLSQKLGLQPGSFNFLRTRWLLGFVLVGIALLALFLSFTTYIRPNQLGILRVRFGMNKGIKKKIFHAGRYFIIPGWERMYLFPKSLQMIQWNKNYNRELNQQGYRGIPPIRIQTSEGYNVQTDVTIQYRISNPYKVMTTIGPGSLYEDSALIPRSEKILRLVLGELNAEEFYRGPKRIAKATEAQKRLNKDLQEKGIEIRSILVMEFQYDNRYQRMIESRKLQDQRVFLQQAEKLATIQRFRKRVIIEKGKARVNRELARGEREVARILTAARLYERQRKAQGYLLEKLAEARGIELKNRALEGAGSQYLVAMKMAELFKGIELLVLPSNGKTGVNPINLLKTLTQLEVKGDDKPTSRPVLQTDTFTLPAMKPPTIPQKILQRSQLSGDDEPLVAPGKKRLQPTPSRPSPLVRTPPKQRKKNAPPSRSPQRNAPPSRSKTGGK